MARGKYFSADELDVIRLGVKWGHSVQRMADYLGRTRMGVFNQIKKMEAAGTLENVPFDFMGKGSESDQ